MTPTELFHAIRYAPHVGQFRFHQSDARFKVLIAGARFGKSLASARDVTADIVGGDTRGWLVGPTYSLARPEYDYVREDLYHMGVRFTEQSDGLHGAACLRVGRSEVRCLSARIPQTLLGREIDWLILCEAAHIDRDAFERFLRARLSTRNGRLIVPTTPRGHNWIHALYTRALDASDWDAQRYATWDNPGVSKEEIEAARRSLPEETFDEQYGGAFTSPSGRVYREFEPALHVREGLNAPAGAVICKSIDFGFTNPFACLWGALDGDGRLLVLREHVASGKNLEEHSKSIRAIDDEFEAQGCAIGPAFADPAGALERESLRSLGLRTQRADNRLSGGIDVVRRRLKVREDGTPGLMVDASCRTLLREFENYLWEESSKEGERVPRKHDDHTLDALRYLCVGLDRRPDWQHEAPSW